MIHLGSFQQAMLRKMVLPGKPMDFHEPVFHVAGQWFMNCLGHTFFESLKSRAASLHNFSVLNMPCMVPNFRSRSGSDAVGCGFQRCVASAVKKAEKLRNAVRLPNPPFKGIQQTYLIQWLPIHKSLHAMALTPIYIYIFPWYHQKSPRRFPIHTLHWCFNSPIFRQALQNPSLPTAQLAAAVLLDLPEAPVEGHP